MREASNASMQEAFANSNHLHASKESGNDGESVQSIHSTKSDDTVKNHENSGKKVSN